MVAALFSARLAVALPENGQIVQGQLQLAQPNSNVLQVLQSSPSGIINWGSFNIGSGQLVQFLQPDLHSAVLNRVVGQDPSQILGQIQANGQVILVNPNGILFGPGSSVNAGSFMATTLALEDQDFLQGRFNLHLEGPLRAVVNQGDIRVTEGGFIALISPLVQNQGTLLAERGQVVLGASTRASLSVDARGLLQVVLGQASQAPGTVMLTPDQMTDTLASLVRGPGQESQRIVETSQGLALVGAEGVVLNDGNIGAGSVLLDSSSASVQSGSIQAEEIRILSAGSAVQTGPLTANFAEVSGARVHLTQGLQNGGQLLIDPLNLAIVAAGGTRTPDILAGDDAGTNQSVDASALDPVGGGIVRLEATDTISLGASVNVLLTHPNVDLRLTAPNVLMATTSSIQASHPSDKLTISATGMVELSNIGVADVRVNGGNVHLQGSLGLAGSPNLIDIHGNQVSWDGPITVGGGTSLAANITASGALISGAGSVLDFSGPTSYARLSGGGIQLDNSRVKLVGSGNLTLNSGAAISLTNGSEISATGPANISLTALGNIDLQSGTKISSNDLGSSALLNGGNLRLGTLEIVNVQGTTNGQLNFNDSLLGLPGQNLQAHFTANRFVQKPGASLTIVGATANVVIDSLIDFELQTGSSLTSTAGLTNLTLHSHDSGTFQANSFLQATGPANVSLNADHGTLFFAQGSNVELAGAGNLNVTNPVGAITMVNGASLGAASPLASLYLLAGTDIQLGNLPASHVNIDGNSAFGPTGGTVSFQNSQLGVAGTDSVVNVTAHNLNFVTGNVTELRGNHARVNLNASNEVKFQPGSQLLVQAAQTDFNLQNGGTFLMEPGAQLVDSGAGNYSIRSAWIINDASNRISIAGPGGHLSMSSTTDLLVCDLEVAHIDLAADGSLFLVGSSLGRAGQPTSVNATALADAAFVNNQLQLNGSSVNATISAGGALQNFAPPLVVQGNAPTRLELHADTMDLTSSNISLPNKDSNLILQTQGNLTADQMTGGRIELASNGANLTLLSPIVADQVVLRAGQDLTAQSSTPLLARQSLEVNAGRVKGPVDLAPAGLVSALPFATDPAATVHFQVSGTNDTQLGNRAANLFYAGSSNGNVQIDSPNGEVLLYREGGSPQQPANQTGAARAEVAQSAALSGAQQAELANQSALVQISLSNFYSSRELPSTGSVLFLQYDNLGLINFWPVSLLTPVVELVVLSPEELVDRQRRRSESSYSVVVGDDEDEVLRYWRRLLQGFIIWEDE
ncbi:MAG: filamentous hemagglutinin N-terminal domain-containing protein [Vulcanimicrobiota bacterium]